SIDACLAAPAGAEAFRALRSVFLTAEGEPRSEAHFIPARLRADHPGTASFLTAEQERLLAAFDAHAATRIVDLTGALCDIGGRIVSQYERRKQAAGAYDYDDLIRRTLRMFSSLSSGWVLYKLDGGVDHVLLDEAQDTSRDQWSIVRSLSEEFFAGRGVRPEVRRTIFAVGDEKQSIFGFQGASPALFRDMGRHYGERSRAAGSAFEEVELNVSFRSAQAVLDMVDAVFPGQSHFARRRNVAGRVELWPLEPVESQTERDPWRAPTGYALRDRPRRRLAARIAATIRRWIDCRELLPSEGRPVIPSDIMILVRNRTTLMDELVRALKTAGLPVAGADRLALTSHVAVMDLMALGRALLLPADDQMLACVLKGALILRDDDRPIDDDDLFALCHGRGSATLWDRLAAAVAAGGPYAKALGLLRDWREAALNRPPFEFYMAVLGTSSIYGRLLGRLGGEAEEPVDAFLTQCLDYDRRHSPSLEGFLHWLDGEQAMIKRDMDHGLGEIRVMTVHGAKGLESNIVILPDTCGLPDRGKDPGLLTCEADVSGRTIEVPLWRVKEGRDHPRIGALRDRLRDAALAEYDRLLYVAMTRARDRLYVCGHPDRSGTRELAAECWYSRIEAALKAHGRSLTDEEGRTVWRYESAADAVSPIAVPSDAEKPVAPPPALPLWALAPAPPEPEARIWQSAARLTQPGGERITPPLGDRDPKRYRRGILIHRLLQVLPDLAPSAREAAARRFLAQPGHAIGPAEQRDILGGVLRLLSDSRFAAVFGPGSQAEVPFAAEIDGVAVTGRFDRLVVTQSEILVLDYKTNRPPPKTIADTDPTYIRQLAIYRRALAAMFPRHRVRAALLWTEAPRLMEVPSDLLNGNIPSENQMELPLTV
ncbi:MAG TPA: UvrD-helicase domain-containing protein, partial [Aestuariivirgaceae bacterium]|nr:UvrD-helicase domain-containing protein [Aestuariivirgaceae bacterium]